jgi:hypothetical protein
MLKRVRLPHKYHTVHIFDMSSMPEEDKISADLVSDRCQFCGASFNRANQLSLHYKEKHSDKLGEEGDSP